MTDSNIKALNSVTKTLIDSCKGYETCADISDDSYALQAEFKRRKNERSQLVGEFQNQVRQLGGEPVDSGSVKGAVHRSFTRFSSMFQDDEAAAISALDDGEEYLAEKIEDKLEDGYCSPSTQALLVKAHQSAASGERFADMLDC
ncbi:PA2169 family four-helix-bundle protein [Hellea sp.]|nr:PA2169 family four-helix-bundle protein [Hellea sp.]